ncbi:MAG TPA: hypothetical protein DCG38_11955 [Eubacteriaceae bacterium]|nr:hypothetical protein [Eubacteriaceae bacterium]
MSMYQFLASEMMLDGVENPYIEIISVNEAIKRGVNFDESLMNNPSFDRDEEKILICDTEEHMDEIEINYVGSDSEKCSEGYTELQNIHELNWCYSEERAQKLVDYLKKQITAGKSAIELWNIWLGETKSAIKKHVKVENLSVSDLELLDVSSGLTTPICLVVESKGDLK